MGAYIELMMTDTTAEARQERIDAIRRMTPSARIAQALDFSETMRRLSLGRLRLRHPERTELQLVELLLGVALPRADTENATSR